VAPSEARGQASTPLEALEARVRSSIVDSLRKNAPAPEGDPALDAACKGAAGELAAGVDRQAAVTYLRRWMLDEQVSDAIYLPFTIEMGQNDPVPRELLVFVGDELALRGITHLGVGAVATTPGRALLALVMVRRLVTHSPFPREVAAGSKQLLWVKPAVASPHTPSLVLAGPDGVAFAVPPSGQARGDGALPFTVELDRGAGRYVLQVVAEDAYGPLVVNRIETWVDQPALRVVESPLAEPAGDSADAQRAFVVEAINALRTRAGLRPVALAPSLSAIAMAHSEDMAAQGYFGHRSPSRGDLAQRLGAERLSGVYARENIAMSVSVAWATDSLADSPSHRQALLDERVDSVGVGVARRHSGSLEIVYVTQVLADLEP
jgi:uncharacterized protein YkwD